MRIGFIGPLHDADVQTLRDAAEFLLGDVEVDQAIYLGEDGAADAMADAWVRELEGEGEGDFLARAASVAREGTADDILAFLAADHQVERLGRLRTLPPPPARAVEMVEDRIVLAVHDKAILDEEDIANASVIVYGHGPKLLLKRFGPRYFLTPGPLSEGAIVLLDADEEGKIVAAAYQTTGAPVWQEVLQGKKSKVSVS